MLALEKRASRCIASASTGSHTRSGVRHGEGHSIDTAMNKFFPSTVGPPLPPHYLDSIGFNPIFLNSVEVTQ